MLYQIMADGLHNVCAFIAEKRYRHSWNRSEMKVVVSTCTKEGKSI